MEETLFKFVNTLDQSLKKMHEFIGERSGFSGLTISQLQYIDAIAQMEPVSITEIAEKLEISKASVTAGVNKLVSSGYVNKRQSQQDRRVFHVSLTDTGKKMVEVKNQTLKNYGRFINSVLEDEERTTFFAILEKLVEQFERWEKNGFDLMPEAAEKNGRAS